MKTYGCGYALCVYLIIGVLVAAVFAAGCTDERELGPGSTNEATLAGQVVGPSTAFAGTRVYDWSYQGHQYLVARCPDGISMVHAASCPHPSHKPLMSWGM